MVSNLIDHVTKPSGTLGAIMLAIITHWRQALMAYPDFYHHHYPSAENQ